MIEYKNVIHWDHHGNDFFYPEIDEMDVISLYVDDRKLDSTLRYLFENGFTYDENQEWAGQLGLERCDMEYTGYVMIYVAHPNVEVLRKFVRAAKKKGTLFFKDCFKLQEWFYKQPRWEDRSWVPSIFQLSLGLEA